MRFYEDLSVIDEKLYFVDKRDNRTKLALPSDKIFTAIDLIHSNILSGHLGSKRSKEKLFARFFRPKLGQYVDQFIKFCEICQKTKILNRLPKAKLKPIITDHPLQLVTMDIVGPLPLSTGGNIYILVIYPPNPEQSKVEMYLKQLKEHLAEAFEQVKLNRDLKLEKTHLLYNRNIKPETYQVGELVLKNVVTIKQGLSKKLAHKWEGPFVIVKHLNDLNYQVRWAKNPKSKARTVHHNLLKRYFGPFPTISDEPSSNEPELTQPTPHSNLNSRNVKKRGRQRNITNENRPKRNITPSNPIPKQPHPNFKPPEPAQNDPIRDHETDRPTRKKRPVDRLTYYPKI
ncbi:Retrovirus-related Pol poly from transposon [Brachionus plicatilis]|uniref:Retrovirus-related Pol poly from transposon n=1 Tax=Brachionus plicatilis TaxID=10195 RepID=A0A3M7R7N6_BRAPC|nr:Retrovirus-related Pol poly from transposon [Brachionus plicatilis]